MVGSSVNLHGQWTHLITNYKWTHFWKGSGIKPSVMFWFAYSVTGLTLNMPRLHDLWFWLCICKTGCIWILSCYGQSCSYRYNSGTGASCKGMEFPCPFWMCHPSNTSRDSQTHPLGFYECFITWHVWLIIGHWW